MAREPSAPPSGPASSGEEPARDDAASRAPGADAREAGSAAGPRDADAGTGSVSRADGALHLVIPRGLLAGLVVTAVLLASFLVWRVAHVFLVIFAAALVAILLDGLARVLVEKTRIPRTLALAAVLASLVAAVGVFSLAGGPQLAEQVAELTERIPEAAAQLRQQLGETGWGRVLIRRTPPASELLSSGAELLGRVPILFSNVTGVVTNVVFILLIGVYAALDPGLYVRGALHLVPKAGRERAGQVLYALGHALRWWLLGRLAAMVVVGLLTGIGLWAIGLPLAPALGAIAGLFSFVPFVGPIVSAVPAILVALVSGFAEAVWVVGVYSGVQFIEGNFVTPIIQQRVVSLPPAVLLSSQLAMGILFGLVGVLLATPLTVVIMVLVQMLYVQQALGDGVEVLGSRVGGARDA
ncbi:MAG: AI-2E family transporter [Myxococcota bacterium]|nr:AI-2E family transporter [Myxococcota bacterium]